MLLKFTHLIALVMATSASAPANAMWVETSCTVDGCAFFPPHPVAFVGALAVIGEQACRDDTSSSCTEEVKTAVKNLGDYLTFKKNVGRSLERKTEGVRDGIRAEHRRWEKKTKKIRGFFKF